MVDESLRQEDSLSRASTADVGVSSLGEHRKRQSLSKTAIDTRIGTVSPNSVLDDNSDSGDEQKQEIVCHSSAPVSCHVEQPGKDEVPEGYEASSHSLTESIVRIPACLGTHNFCEGPSQIAPPENPLRTQKDLNFSVWSDDEGLDTCSWSSDDDGDNEHSAEPSKLCHQQEASHSSSQILFLEEPAKFDSPSDGIPKSGSNWLRASIDNSDVAYSNTQQFEPYRQPFVASSVLTPPSMNRNKPLRRAVMHPFGRTRGSTEGSSQLDTIQPHQVKDAHGLLTGQQFDLNNRTTSVPLPSSTAAASGLMRAPIKASSRLQSDICGPDSKQRKGHLMSNSAPKCKIAPMPVPYSSVPSTMTTVVARRATPSPSRLLRPPSSHGSSPTRLVRPPSSRGVDLVNVPSHLSSRPNTSAGSAVVKPESSTNEKLCLNNNSGHLPCKLASHRLFDSSQDKNVRHSRVVTALSNSHLPKPEAYQNNLPKMVVEGGEPSENQDIPGSSNCCFSFEGIVDSS